MATQQEIIQLIKHNIFQNTEERITGQILQDILVSLVNYYYTGDQVINIQPDNNNIVITYVNGTEDIIPLHSKLPENAIAEFSVGAINKGDDLSGLTLSDVLESILIGNPNPVIQKFYISKKNNINYTYEDNYILQFGEPINIGDEISWDYNPNRYKDNSTTLTNSTTNEVYFENRNNKTFVISNTIIGLTSKGLYPFNIKLKDISDTVYDFNVNLKYGYKIFYGSSDYAILTQHLINTQFESISAYDFPFKTNITINNKGYKYFIIPTLLDNDTWFLRNMKSNFEVPVTQTQTIIVNNGFGIDISYNVYRSAYILDNTIKVIIENE